jgi:hypothetical protein
MLCITRKPVPTWSLHLENTPRFRGVVPSGVADHAAERVMEGRPGHRALVGWGAAPRTAGQRQDQVPQKV